MDNKTYIAVRYTEDNNTTVFNAVNEFSNKEGKLVAYLDKKDVLRFPGKFELGERKRATISFK